MSEMVERVARAICKIEEPDFDPGLDDGGREPPLWTNYQEHAEVAIAAMREPTDGMYGPVVEHGVMRRSTAEYYWKLMIDEALK